MACLRRPSGVHLYWEHHRGRHQLIGTMIGPCWGARVCHSSQRQKTKHFALDDSLDPGAGAIRRHQTL